MTKRRKKHGTDKKKWKTKGSLKQSIYCQTHSVLAVSREISAKPRFSERSKTMRVFARLRNRNLQKTQILPQRKRKLIFSPRFCKQRPSGEEQKQNEKKDDGI